MVEAEQDEAKRSAVETAGREEGRRADLLRTKLTLLEVETGTATAIERADVRASVAALENPCRTWRWSAH